MLKLFMEATAQSTWIPFCYIPEHEWSSSKQVKMLHRPVVDACHVIPVICHCLIVDKPAAAMDLESARLATIPLAQDSTPFKAQHLLELKGTTWNLSSQSELSMPFSDFIQSELKEPEFILVVILVCGYFFDVVVVVPKELVTVARAPASHGSSSRGYFPCCSARCNVRNCRFHVKPRKNICRLLHTSQ